MSNAPLPDHTVDLSLVPEAQKWQFRPSHRGGFDLAFIPKSDPVNYMAHLVGIAAGRIEIRDSAPIEGQLSPEEQKQKEMSDFVRAEIDKGQAAIDAKHREALEQRQNKEREALEDRFFRQQNGGFSKAEIAERDAIVAKLTKS